VAADGVLAQVAAVTSGHLVTTGVEENWGIFYSFQVVACMITVTA
jgi:hypothetical protein